MTPRAGYHARVTFPETRKGGLRMTPLEHLVIWTFALGFWALERFLCG